MLGENAKVDVLAKHHRGVFACREFLVNPGLLVNGVDIARQRHHFAGRIQHREEYIEIGFDPFDMIADEGIEKPGFGYTELGGEIALAHLGIVASRLLDGGGVW